MSTKYGEKMQMHLQVFFSVLFSNTAELEMFGQLRVLSVSW